MGCYKIVESCKWSPKTKLEHKRAQTRTHKYRHAAKHTFPVCVCVLYVPPPTTTTFTLKHTHRWFLIGSAIRNTITDFCVGGKKKVNSTKYAFLKQITFSFFFPSNLAGTHPSEPVFLRMHACTHTLLLKADPRQYFSFNNANKHLYCFVWWMAWFMRKTSHQQYFSCRIPRDSERGWL